MNAHVNWLGGFDPGRNEAFQRSLTIGNAGTVLFQSAVSKTLQLLTNRALGVQSTLPRKSWTGDGYYSVRRTAANTGAAWVADTDTPVTSEGGMTRVKFGFKTLLGQITITRKLIDQGSTWGDIMANELIGKTDDFIAQLESTSIVGDATASANQIDGLMTLIGAVSGQTIANTSVAGGDSLYLNKLDETIKAVKGHSNKAALRIFASFLGARLINNALQAQQRFVNMVDIEGGFTVDSYQGIPIVESTGIPDDLNWDGSAHPTFTSGSTTAIIVVNTTYVFYAELNPLTVLPLARTTSQSEALDLYADLTLVLDNTLGGAILGGLA